MNDVMQAHLRVLARTPVSRLDTSERWRRDFDSERIDHRGH